MCRLEVIACLTMAAPTFAQEPEIVVQYGDVVDGVTIQRVDVVQVDNGGIALLLGVGTGVGDIVLRDASVHLRDGQTTGAGVLIEAIRGIASSDRGRPGFSICEAPQPGCDPAVLVDDTVLLRAGDPASAPALPVGTVYSSAWILDLTDSNQAVVGAVVYDSQADEYLRAGIQGEIGPAGELTNQEVFFLEDELAPGTGGWPFLGLEYARMNERGDIAFRASLGFQPTDRQAVYVNTTLLATNGSAAPVPGEVWFDLLEGSVDLNSVGDVVYNGLVTGPPGTNVLIVKNDSKFRQSGDTLPALGPGSVLTDFGSRQAWINDLGEVLWLGEWTDAGGVDRWGYLIDDELIVENGVTTLNGSPILVSNGNWMRSAMSRNGRFVAFDALWDGGTSAGVLLIDRRPLGQGFCLAAENSTGRGATLSAAGSTVLSDAELTLTAEDLPPGVPGLFFFGPNQIQAPFGDGFRCVGGAVRRVQPATFANAAGIAVRTLNFSAPYAAALAPGSVSFQLWYRDPMGPGGSGFNTTSGLEIVFS